MAASGDRNTEYFHAKAVQRKLINKIELLTREDGSTCQTMDENHAEVQGFYEALYTSQGFRPMDELLNLIPHKVTPVMNEHLDKPFTAQEDKEALFQMAPSKAPGVDGFTVGFFQRHWYLLQEDIVLAILDFLNSGELPVGMNDTSITLIPNVRYPQFISQYRPISLCPVLYKIASKCITNRAREFMDEIISEE